MPRPAPHDARRRGVEVPVALLWLLVGAAVAAIASAAYMAGRLASAPAAVTESSPAGPVVEAAKPEPDTTPGPSHASALETPTPPPTISGTAPRATGTPDAARAASTPTVDPAGGARRDVAAYFAALDGLNVDQSLSGDPQALAQKILMRALGGDLSGIDELAESQRAALQALRGISPPPACAEHYRRTVALMEKTAGLMSRLRGAIDAGNAEGLADLEGVAREAERESNELKALDRALRRTYGLAAPPEP